MPTIDAQIDVEVPAKRLWAALKDFTNIATKLMPEAITNYYYIEGNGAPGSVRVAKFGPAVKGFTYVKEKVLMLDDASMSTRYQVQGGELLDYYSSYIASLTVSRASSDEAASIVTWKVEYEPNRDGIAAPENAKLAFVAAIKSLEAFLVTKTDLYDIA